jgi:hypothetical protein
MVLLKVEELESKSMYKRNMGVSKTGNLLGDVSHSRGDQGQTTAYAVVQVCLPHVHTSGA